MKNLSEFYLERKHKLNKLKKKNKDNETYSRMIDILSGDSYTAVSEIIDSNVPKKIKPNIKEDDESIEEQIEKFLKEYE